jgi:hypothetical protein
VSIESGFRKRISQQEVWMNRVTTNKLILAAAGVALLPVLSAHAGSEAFVDGGANDFVGNYAGSQNNTFYENNTTSSDNTQNGGNTHLNARGSGSARWRFILDFDLSSITPYESQVSVTGVSLELTQYANVAFGGDIMPLTVSLMAGPNYGWNQYTSTGLYYNSTTTPPTDWKNASGASVGPPLNGTPTANNPNYAYELLFTQSTSDPNDYVDGNAVGTQYQITDSTGNLLSAVKGWINTPTANGGLFLQPYSGDNTSITMEYYSDIAATPQAYRPTLILSMSSPTMSSDYVPDADGNWSNSGNWDNGVPGTIGATANFGTSPTTSLHTITLDAPEIVSSLNFSSAYGYNIVGSNTLTIMEVNNNQATVGVTAGNVNIETPVLMNTSTTFNIASGSTLAFTGGMTATGRSITLNGPGSLSIPAATLGTLTVNSGLLKIAPHSGASSVATLSIAGGAAIDLADTSMSVAYVLDPSNPLNPPTSPLSTIVGYLQSGYNGGAWNGTGLISSDVASHLGTSLGYIDTGTTVNVAFTWLGDLDLSGVVDGNDLAAMGVIPTTGPETGLVGWFDGDLNYDGVINADDWALFELGAAASAGANISTVPEPALMGFMALGALTLNRRRRRN